MTGSLFFSHFDTGENPKVLISLKDALIIEVVTHSHLGWES